MPALQPQFVGSAAKRGSRLFLTASGAVLLAVLVWRIGSANILADLRGLGWGLSAILALGGLSHLVKTGAWRFTFPRQHRTIPFFRLFGMRLAGEAVAQVSWAGQILGETTRALLLRTSVPADAAVLSVILDRSLYALTGLSLIVVGTGAALFSSSSPDSLRASSALLILSLFLLTGLLGALFFGKWPILTLPTRLLGRIAVFRPLALSVAPVARQIETALFSFHREDRRALVLSIGLNLTGHALSILEVFLILRLLGVDLGLFEAFMIEILTKMVNLAGVLIPGNLGAYEAGNMLILSALRMGAPAGFILALSRRVRGLFWTTIGLLVLLRSGLQLRPAS